MPHATKSSRLPPSFMDTLRRWAPVMLIVACVVSGWFHGTFVIGTRPPNVPASLWAAHESQAIQQGANAALLLVAWAAWIHRRRLLSLQWLVLESPTALVIAGELAFVLSLLYGALSNMGMPGLFWHFQPRVQFFTGTGVTLYAFWMLSLLFESYEERMATSGGRCFWARHDGQWPGRRPESERESGLAQFLRYVGAMLIFVLVLPASFPTMRAWDHHRTVEWPWLAGVAAGTIAVAIGTRLRLLARLDEVVAQACGRFFTSLRRWAHLPLREVSPKATATAPANGNPVLLVSLLYAISYLDQITGFGLLRHVLPAGVSLCVLLGVVASLLVWLQSRSPKTKTAIILGLLGLMTLTGARDYKVPCRDLSAYYPTSLEQYDAIVQGLIRGKAATRLSRAEMKRSEEQPPTYRDVVDLATLQEKLFEPERLAMDAEQARTTREEWLRRWKSKLAGETESPKPVLVVICTSGGALRAALWTEVVLDHLSKSLPGFASRVRLVTGASGGMLGAARFVVSINEDSPMPAIVRDSPPDYLEAIARQIALHDLIPDMFLPWSTPNRGDVLEDEFGRYEPLRDESARAQGAKRQAVGINTTFGQLMAAERDGLIPSIIFSPMIAEDGRRLLISNQPLADLATHAEDFPMMAEDVGELTARLRDAGQPATGSQLDLELPLVASTPAIEFFGMFGSSAEDVRQRFKLSSAVRMSATFPYVTPSVVLPTDPPRHVVDAGYYDNFGVNLAARWIAGNAGWIKENTAGVLVVQIRAFRNERSLKLYDPDYHPANPLSVAGAEPSRSLFPSLHVAQGLLAGFREWFVPLQGAAQAQNRSMYFRNDEQLLALQEAFTTPEDDDFFKTVVFTCDSNTPGEPRGTLATLNWYMSGDEFSAIKANMLPLSKSEHGRDRNALRMERLEAWWSDRGQGN